jgi:hypothetical protein
MADLEKTLANLPAAIEKLQISNETKAEAMKKSLEEQGRIAEDSKEYTKLNYQAKREEINERLKHPDLSKAARKELKQEKAALDKKQGNLLGKIAGGITGMRDDAKDKMRAAGAAAGKGIMAILKATLVAGALIAVVAFLDSEYWVKTKKFILDKVIPILKELFEFLKDNWGKIITGILIVKAVLVGMKVVALFKKIKAAYLAVKALTIKSFLDPLKDMLKGAWTKILATWGLIKKGFLALKAATIANVLEPLKLAVKNAAAGVWKFMKLIPPALVALKVFFLSTFLPAVTAFMVPLLPIIAIVAAVSLALYALWNAFGDFCKTLNETGSIGEALKVGIAKFMGTILGFIPMIVLKLVGWVAGLFGFDDFKAKVDAIDPIQWISDTIKGLFDKLFVWFGLLFKDPVKAMKDLVKGFFGGFLNIADWLVDMIKKPLVWLLELFGWDDAAAAVETFSLKGFVMETWDKVKCWFIGLFSWAAKEDSGDSWLIKTVKGVITGVKEWFGNMFDFGTLKSSLASLINIVTWLPNLVWGAVSSVTAWLLGLFGFDKAAEKVANASNWTIGGLIMGVVDSVVCWLKGLFAWGKKAGTTEDGEFSLVKLISETITKIWDWFKGLLDIDFKKIAKAIIPDWAPGWIKSAMGIGGDDGDDKKDAGKAIKKHGQTLEGAEEAGLYDQSNIMGFDSDINKKALKEGVKSGLVQKEMLDAILADKDLSKEDTAFMKKLVEQATKKGSLYVADLGLHDRLDRIFPSTKNEERNNTMTESALQKSVGSQNAAGPTIIDSSQKVVNANKTGVQNFGTPLKNTNLAGTLAAA